MALLGRRREQPKKPSSKDWLDAEGRFTKGKYGPKDGKPGRSAELVAVTDPRYLLWLLENVENISEEDRSIINTLLKYRSRTEAEED